MVRFASISDENQSSAWPGSDDAESNYYSPFLEEAFANWHYNEVEGLAKTGQVDAQLEVAWRNQTGVKAPWGQENFEKAERWFREAANAGDALGQFYLANFLLHKKPRQVTWLHRLREKMAGKRLATPDEIEAYMWLTLAARQKRRFLMEVQLAAKEKSLMEQWMSPAGIEQGQAMAGRFKPR